MGKDRKCVFCDDKAHASWNCTVVSGINERRQVVRDKKLCYNCIGASHRASQCRSKKGCFYCGALHHTSLCDKPEEGSKPATPNPVLFTPQTGTIYPVALAKVNGVTTRVFLDTGTGSRYCSSKLVLATNAQLKTKVKRQVEMMLTSKTMEFEIYSMMLTSL